MKPRRYIVDFQEASASTVQTRVFRSHDAAQDFVNKHRAIAYATSKRRAKQGKLKRRSAWVWFQQRVT